MPGLVYVSAQTGFDSTVYKSVTVECPAGLRVIGMAYNLSGAPGSVVLDDFIPNATSVTVGAGEVVGPGEPSDGTTLSWSVTATAVCAVAPPGLEIVSARSGTQQGTPFARVDAFCPGTKVLLGAGAALSQGFGQISISALQLVGGHASATAIDDEDHYSGTWTLTTYAICADWNPDVETVSNNNSMGSPTSAWLRAICPVGKRAISVGWWVNTEEQVLATGVSFEFDNQVGRVDAHEDDNGYSGWWQLGVRATCITP
jgi:hypothetical protein